MTFPETLAICSGCLECIFPPSIPTLREGLLWEGAFLVYHLVNFIGDAVPGSGDNGFKSGSHRISLSLQNTVDGKRCIREFNQMAVGNN